MWILILALNPRGWTFSTINMWWAAENYDFASLLARHVFSISKINDLMRKLELLKIWRGGSGFWGWSFCAGFIGCEPFSGMEWKGAGRWWVGLSRFFGCTPGWQICDEHVSKSLWIEKGIHYPEHWRVSVLKEVYYFLHANFQTDVYHKHYPWQLHEKSTGLVSTPCLRSSHHSGGTNWSGETQLWWYLVVIESCALVSQN